MNIIQVIRWLKKGNMVARPNWHKEDFVIGDEVTPKALFYEDDILWLQTKEYIVEYSFAFKDILSFDWVRI